MTNLRLAQMVVFNGADKALEYEEITIPTLKPNEWLVKNLFTTLCRSDILTYAGKRMEQTPTILGHEVCGILVEAGPEAPLTDMQGNQLRPGDKVTWAIFASKPDDPLSIKGISQKADGLFKYGHEKISGNSVLHGGLASHTILRAHTPIVKISAHLPLPVAALINCAVATVMGAFRLAGLIKGSRVLITGAGMLGLVASAWASTAGALSITLMDIDNCRLQKATEFGASNYLTAAELYNHEAVYDIALDFTGNPEVMEKALIKLHIGGTAIWVGATYPQVPVKLDAELIVRRILTIKGLHNYNSNDLLNAVHFIETYHTRFPFIKLVEGAYSLKQAKEAFEAALKKGPYRIGIDTSLTT